MTQGAASRSDPEGLLLKRTRGPPLSANNRALTRSSRAASDLRSYLVFDFETTGLNTDTDRIIQVGLCIVSEGTVVGRFEWLVNQNVEIPREATRIHGISTDDIRTRGIAPHDSAVRIHDAMKRAPTCIGHNIHRFDVPFLLAESRRLGFQPPDCEQFIDTVAIFKGRKLGMSRNPAESPKAYADRVLSVRAPGLKYSIPTCLAELGIEAGTARLHDASHDAYLTHLIFQTLRRTI